MRIAIYDNNKTERELLLDLLSRYFYDNSVKCEFVQYDTAMQLYKDISNSVLYDMIFLDMYLSDESLGMQIAQILIKKHFSGKLFLCTASTANSFDGYDAIASDYIVKPINSQKTETTLNRYLKEFKPDFLTIKQRSKFVYIPLKDIMYCESINTKCIITCVDGRSYTIYKQLSKVEDTLCDECFLRCHQSYIVNMNYIKEAEDVFTLTSGAKILIRKKEKRKMHEKYINFMNSHNNVVAI